MTMMTNVIYFGIGAIACLFLALIFRWIVRKWSTVLTALFFNSGIAVFVFLAVGISFDVAILFFDVDPRFAQTLPVFGLLAAIWAFVFTVYDALRARRQSSNI